MISDRPSLEKSIDISSTKPNDKSSQSLLTKSSSSSDGKFSSRNKKSLTVKELLSTDEEPRPVHQVSLHNAASNRNPITGEGFPLRRQQIMYAANRRRDGNPLLGIGYGKNIKT